MIKERNCGKTPSPPRDGVEECCEVVVAKEDLHAAVAERHRHRQDGEDIISPGQSSSWGLLVAQFYSRSVAPREESGSGGNSAVPRSIYSVKGL